MIQLPVNIWFFPLLQNVFTMGVHSKDTTHMVHSRGVLNTPDPQIYLGLMIGIWASLGCDFASFSIFYPTLGLFMGKFCHFATDIHPSLGLHWFNMPLVHSYFIWPRTDISHWPDMWNSGKQLDIGHYNTRPGEVSIICNINILAI